LVSTSHCTRRSSISGSSSWPELADADQELQGNGKLEKSNLKLKTMQLNIFNTNIKGQNGCVQVGMFGSHHQSAWPYHEETET
jgi:hypothetical protein